MKPFFYVIILAFSFHLSAAQNHLPTQQSIDKQYEKINNPSSDEQAKKIEQLIEASQKINYKDGIIEGKIKLLYIFYHRSDFTKMLKSIKEAEALGLTNNHQMSILNIHKSYVNKAMGIEKEELQNIKDAVKYAKLIEDPDKRHFSTSTAYNRFSVYYDYKKPDSLIHYLKKELEELEQINDGNQKLRFEKYASIALNNINIGNFYIGVHKPMRLDLAEPYYLKVYNYKNTQPAIYKELNMQILCGVSRFYHEKRDYIKSIELANEVLAIEKKKKNPSYRVYAYMLIANSYEELKNPEQLAKYTMLYANLNDSLNTVAKKEVSQEFDRLITDAKKEKDEEHTSNLKIILLASVIFILLLVFVLWFYWRKKNKTIQNNYQELITKLNLEDTSAEILENNKNPETKPTISITDETLKNLLLKIEKFEKSDKYLKKEISLTYLANSIGTNTKYLSEIIKLHKGKSFNNYINGLRIDYIVRQLYSNPKSREYKISHLADMAGFASREVFAVVFKKETGITPSFFINNLKKESSID